MTKYKMRAEVAVDVDAFAVALAEAEIAVANWEVIPDDSGLPDVEVVFVSAAPLKALRVAASKVTDGHVMQQTLAQFDEYTGERAFNASDADEAQS